MKTCVLFPHAFTYDIIGNNAVATANAAVSNELFIDPIRKSRTKSDFNQLKRKLRKKMYFLTNNKEYKKIESKKMQILHVEDNPQIRLITSIFLKRESALTSVENGEKALEVAKSNHFDLILMDVNLGDGIDGFETTRRIRKINRFQNTPIIAITANEYGDVRGECLNSGINAYIQKPFEKSHLMGTIREIDNHLANTLY